MVTVGLPAGVVSGGVVEVWDKDSVEPGWAESSRSGKGSPEFVAVTSVNLSAPLPERQGADTSKLKPIEQKPPWHLMFAGRLIQCALSVASSCAQCCLRF
jgi:hypothetical protein